MIEEHGARGSIETVSEGVKPSPERSALLITYYYPPSGGPGVQRVLKFSRYLPQFGYRPLILTVPESAEFPVIDRSLENDIPPEAVIERAPILEFYSLYRWMTGQRKGGRHLDLEVVSSRRGSWRERLSRALRASLFIPDGRVGWLPGATARGLALIEKHRPSVIFASGPPFTTHWIGQRLAKRSGLPLVVDYRDPWTRAPYYPMRPAWARRLDEKLEHRCLRDASAIVTVNRTIREQLLSHYSGLTQDRFHQIANGYDPADFAERTPRPTPQWTLVHTGSLQDARAPHAFLQAIESWLRDDPTLGESLVLRFVGRLDAGLEARLSAPPFDRVVRLEGYRPHGESVQALFDSHLLLLLILDDPQSRGMLTGKLFEYLGSGRPILALAPEGEAAELIRRTGAGRVLRGDDPIEIRAALAEARAAFLAGKRPFGEARPDEVIAYSRIELTRRLAGIFDRLAAPSLSDRKAGV
ncbi:MAG: glycosyltransferase [Candidatus Eisenbacteria bacterium]